MRYSPGPSYRAPVPGSIQLLPAADASLGPAASVGGNDKDGPAVGCGYV